MEYFREDSMQWQDRLQFLKCAFNGEIDSLHIAVCGLKCNLLAWLRLGHFHSREVYTNSYNCNGSILYNLLKKQLIFPTAFGGVTQPYVGSGEGDVFIDAQMWSKCFKAMFFLFTLPVSKPFSPPPRGLTWNLKMPKLGKGFSHLPKTRVLGFHVKLQGCILLHSCKVVPAVPAAKAVARTPSHDSTMTSTDGTLNIAIAPGKDDIPKTNLNPYCSKVIALKCLIFSRNRSLLSRDPHICVRYVRSRIVGDPRITEGEGGWSRFLNRRYNAEAVRIKPPTKIAFGMVYVEKYDSYINLFGILEYLRIPRRKTS